MRSIRKLTAEQEDYLKRIYSSFEYGAAYTNPYKLRKIANRENVHVFTKGQIDLFLRKQDSYTIYKQPRERKNGLHPYIASYLRSHLQADLADVNNLSKHNDNIKFLLVVIDVLSRFLYVQPLKDKSHKEILKGFATIISQIEENVQNVFTDRGSEFRSHQLKDFLSQHGVKIYHANTSKKAGMVERSILTLKRMMYGYFQNKQTYRYLDVLQDLVKNYNTSPHRALKFKSPRDVTDKNQHKVWAELYLRQPSKTQSKRRKFSYAVGDKVRVSHSRTLFKRGYSEQFSSEVYIVQRRVRIRAHPAYKLKDYNNEQILGWFYERELTKVDKPENALWLIDKIIKRRTKAGKRELYVSFIGFDKRHNAWVDAASLEDV